MPLPNEHSARLQQPGRFNPDTFRRTDDGTIYGKIKVPSTAAVIWGKLKGRDKPADQPVPQAIRFPTKNWTAAEAKKWLKDNNVKYIRFEPASGDKKEDSVQSPSVSQSIQSVLAELQVEHWAMEAHALEALLTAVRHQTTAPPPSLAIETKPPALRMDGSTAVIPIRGVLMKEIPAAFAWWGIEGTSYRVIQEQIGASMADDRIKTIRLEIDSPGGTVSGVHETAEAIREANKTKAVTAVIDDLGASAAYWLSSQASQIAATRNSEVGAIGVFAVYRDSSTLYRDHGIKTIVIRSGEHKGMGVPGAEITENQIAAVQQIVDGIATNFIAAVANGRQRSKSNVSEWATGQLWLADAAMAMGLIDRIAKIKTTTLPKEKKTMEETTDSQIDSQIAENARREVEAQKTEALKDQARAQEQKRLIDLRATFPDDLAFAVESFEAGRTVEQAKAAYCDVLQQRIKEQARKPQVSVADGAPPLGGQTEQESEGDFIAAARELAEQKNISLTAAMRQLRRRQPQLHEQFKQRCETDGDRMYQEAC